MTGCPGWCARHTESVPEVHLSAEVIAEGVSVQLVQAPAGLLHIYCGALVLGEPEQAKMLGLLLATLGHAELAAAVTRTAEMAAAEPGQVPA